MRKTKIETRTEKVEILEDVICNKCGGSCQVDNGGHVDYEGMFGIDITGGYGSRHLGDMNQYKFDVCEKCLVEWMNTFKHDPQVGIE